MVTWDGWIDGVIYLSPERFAQVTEADKYPVRANEDFDVVVVVVVVKQGREMMGLCKR